jgi:hypothetical protein
VTRREDWPVLRCAPGPTDAELIAWSNEKHARAVAHWLAVQASTAEDDEFSFDHVPPGAVRG